MVQTREAVKQDYEGLMQLYTQLHDNHFPLEPTKARQIWSQILADTNHHVIVAEEAGEILSSCICVIIPNLTHWQQPYALVENVITDSEHRCQGLATKCLNYAADIARQARCYKIMLMTGAKDEPTLHFYEQAGYNRKDKTAFIRWF